MFAAKTGSDFVVSKLDQSGDIYTAAVALHDLGCSVFPVRGKKPAIGRMKEFFEHQADAHQIWDWFAFRDDLGIGLALGSASEGTACRDFDDPDSYERWKASHPRLARELPTSKTERGFHVFFRTDSPIASRMLADGELRAERNFVTAPPSLHPSGTRYRWQRPLESLPRIVDPYEFDIELMETLNEKAQLDSEKAAAGTPNTSWVTVGGYPLQDLVTEAIRWTRPRRRGERHRRLFCFVRRLAAIPQCVGCDGRDLLEHAQRWFNEALPYIATKSWAVTRDDFLAGWKRVRYPWMEGTLADAIAWSESNPLSEIGLTYSDPVLRRLVGTCQALQQFHGDSPFFLSTTSFAAFGLTNKMAMSRRLIRLINDEVIQRVSIGNSIKGRASEYRYQPRLNANGRPLPRASALQSSTPCITSTERNR